MTGRRGGVGSGLVEGWGRGRVITKSKRWEICSERKRRRGGSDECTDVSHPAEDGKDSGSSGLPSPRNPPPPRRGLSVGLTSNRLTDNLSATLGSSGGKTSFCQSGWITARDEAAFNPGIKIWAIFTF